MAKKKATGDPLLWVIILGSAGVAAFLLWRGGVFSGISETIAFPAGPTQSGGGGCQAPGCGDSLDYQATVQGGCPGYQTPSSQEVSQTGNGYGVPQATAISGGTDAALEAFRNNYNRGERHLILNRYNREARKAKRWIMDNRPDLVCEPPPGMTARGLILGYPNPWIPTFGEWLTGRPFTPQVQGVPPIPAERREQMAADLEARRQSHYYGRPFDAEAALELLASTGRFLPNMTISAR